MNNNDNKTSSPTTLIDTETFQTLDVPMSDIIKRQTKELDFGGSGYMTLSDITKNKFAKYEADKGIDIDFTTARGSTDKIIKDSIKRGTMNLMTLPEKATLAGANIVHMVSGIGTDDHTISDEILERAHDTLAYKIAQIQGVSNKLGDTETLASQITGGVFSMSEMALSGLMTGGVAPLLEVGIDAIGTGTFNNMQKYYRENDNSLDGYKGHWGDLALDTLNTTAQVVIEKKLGVGRMGKYLTRTGGNFVKEAASGFMQEFSQGVLSDLTEVAKQNEDVNIMLENIDQYLIQGAIGGFLQGALGAATYKYNHGKAVEKLSDVMIRANKPQIDSGKVKESDIYKAADDILVRAESGLVKNIWEELADRIDVNNDRGALRDKLVSEITKARMAALGVDNAADLDDGDIQLIQTIATNEMWNVVRDSWEKGKSVKDHYVNSIYADGSVLKFKDAEAGVREADSMVIKEQDVKLGEQMGKEREKLQKARLLKEARLADINKAVKKKDKTKDTETRRQERQQKIEQETQKQQEQQQVLPDTKQTIVEQDIKVADDTKLPQQSSLESQNPYNQGRGKFNPRLMQIVLNKNSDLSTIQHEFAHMWLNNNFKWARSGLASDAFLKHWDAIEEWLDIQKRDKFLDRDASEKFARAYEKWIYEGGKNAPTENATKAFGELNKYYQELYDELATSYFDKVGDLSPEIKEWFEMNEGFTEHGRQNAQIRKDVELQEKAKIEKTALSDELGRVIESIPSETEIVDTADVKSQVEQRPEQDNKFVGKQKERGTAKRVRKLAEDTGVVMEMANTYGTRLSKQAAQEAISYVDGNWEMAQRIALGEESARDGFLDTEIFIAVLNKAMENPVENATLLNDLMMSPIHERTTADAQRIAGLRDWNNQGNINVLKVMKDIDNGFAKKIKDNEGKISSEMSNLQSEIAIEDSKLDSMIDNIIDNMECV